ncbi:MAG: HEAT repeat domain-containing protein [Sandaracinaceae bacterium]|nr:HEAT repeat domain-containing protein [Sandaracinaceae bacterium]
MSDAWTRFHDSVTGAVSSRDSLEQFDLGALASLDAAGREQAEALLASRLDHDDPRVVAALAQLSTPSASVLLRGLADRPEASFMRIAAVALLRDAAAMADVLTRTGRDDLHRGRRRCSLAPIPRRNSMLGCWPPRALPSPPRGTRSWTRP